MNKRPKPPPHLRPPTAKWWCSVSQDYALEEHHSRLLTLAGEAFDRCTQAREILDREGIVTRTTDGAVKAHPCIGIERDSRLAFARILRELDLDVEPPSERARPPALRSNRR